MRCSPSPGTRWRSVRRPGVSRRRASCELAGGSPRYQLYPTKDGRLVACAALEQKFWLALHGGDRPRRRRSSNDLRDPAATTRSGRRHRRGARPRSSGGRSSPQADCCVTIVCSLEEAMRDPHFVGRGLFAHQRRRSARRDHAGAAAADRAGISRRARRQEGAEPRQRQRRHLAQRLAAHQARLRGAPAATPSRITARRSGPIWSSR